jgi:DTW domain-containing protein YfiP
MSLELSKRVWVRRHGMDTPAARPNHMIICLSCGKKPIACYCANPNFIEVRIDQEVN